MKRHNFTLLSFALLLLLAAPAGFAFIEPGGNRLPDFDKRNAGGSAPTPASAAQQSAATRLREQLSRGRVDFDPLTGAPRMVSAVDGFLSGPNGQGNAVSARVAAGFATSDPDMPARAFLQEHRDLFGHGPEALAQARINREYVTEHNGMRTVVWQQQVDGIAVLEAVLIAHTTKRGELVNISSGFLPDPVRAADLGMPGRAVIVATPPVSARAAVAAAGRDVGETITEQDITAIGTAAADAEKRQKFQAQALPGDVTASLVWLPMNRQKLRLCWDVTLTSRSHGEMFRLLVDAQSGEVLLRRSLTRYISDASYNVYTSDSPSPFSPGHPTPLTTQPPLTNRILVTLPALDTNASPAGWINDGGNETTGNNVDAHTDRDNNNSPDLPRPQGSPFRVFDFAMDLATQDPTNYMQAAVVQLFYTCNWMHDRLYQLGFNEASGNFQINNFGRGGLGNDAVSADAQDGGGVNNANMSTPSDGSAPRMQMYIFSGPSPRRDGDFDAEIVLHEYTHGLSWRLVGGGQALGTTQSDGMGEGWSDFYGLSLLSEPGDNVNGCFAAGGYATYQLGGLTQNYYYGIRRYPYCTDMTKNPLTFKDIDPGQASPHTGIPKSPIIGGSASEVHNEGEVWCVTLWEARANLITKYGGAIGNQLMLQLVTDGMKLTPAQPNFLQARDGILQADMVNNGGANLNELWAGFAKRGMGFSATSPASTTSTGVVEAYDTPDDLRVLPTTGLTSSGQAGGPFNPSCQSYIVTNFGPNPLVWVAWTTQPWVDVSLSGGILAPGASNNVDVCLTALTTTLSVGNYSASVIFSNATSGAVASRTVALEVTPPLIVSFPLDTDPGWSRTGEWAFGQPLGLGGTQHGFPDPTSGATGLNVFGINLAGDYVATTVGGPYYLIAGPLDFSGYEDVVLKFQRRLNSDYQPFVYATLDVSSDGVNWTPVWNNGTTEVAQSSWTSVSYNISATADNQPAVYVRWGHRVGQSGAFAYSGWNIDDVQFFGTPPAALSLSLPAGTNEDSTPLTGMVTATPAPVSDVFVTLSSSDTSEVTVPDYVIIYAGQSNAPFDLTFVDDALLDGSQIATISATALLHSGANAQIAVNDNEIATLSVTVPANTTEGDGTVAGTVDVSAVVDSDVLVSLSSSDTTEIQVPATVLILAGQSSANFNATVVNDTLIDGPQNATITAQVVNWTNGAGAITVADNENRNLVVTLPASALETAGVLNNAGQVQLSGTLPTNLVVSLLSSDATEATVPANTTILAGQLSATFNITIVDDPIVDGPQTPKVIASAPGMINGTNSMIVNDDETPAVPSNPNPADLAINVLGNTGLSWNNGAVNITNDVYFGTNATPGPAQFAGTSTSSNWSLPLLLPSTTYYWQIVARHVGMTTGPVWRFTTRLPALTVSNAVVLEGNSGATNLLFNVGLFSASALPVTVNYATSNGTAQAGSDYVATNGVLNFAPGQTNAVIAVSILGETNQEPAEAFSVILSNASNAGISQAVGTGTIVDNDASQVAVFDDPVYVDTTGTSTAESDNVQASIINLGFGATTFALAGLTQAAGTNQCIVIPELENGDMSVALTTGQRAALSNFVMQGGELIINGQTSGRAASLLNAVFGLSLTESTASTTFTRTAQANGTEFADDPATLPVNSVMAGLSTNSLPPGARSIYESAGQSAVAVFGRGNGVVAYLGWDWWDAAPVGTQNSGWLTVLNSALFQRSLPPVPVISAAGASLASESCPTVVIDPGETVTINFGLRNIGSGYTTNLMATLLSTGGVTLPSGPRNYGALAAGGVAVSNAFTLTATGSCGGTLVATLQLQDGGTNLGTVSFAFPLGTISTNFAENFDGVTAPALPAGWTASLTGAGSPWATSTAQRHTLPNAAFAPDPSSTCDNNLASTLFFGGGQLSFRHAYSTESCCDAGWLEISIAGGTFTDILTAGGSFVTNGYSAGNGWRGTSSGYPNLIPTIVNLPAAALGQTNRLRWRFTADFSIAGTGWYVDTILIIGSTCCTGTFSPAIVTQPADQVVTAGSNASFTVLVNGSQPMSYQWRKDGVDLPGRTNQTLLLLAVTNTDAGGYSVFITNIVGSTVSTKASLAVLPPGGTVFTSGSPVGVPDSGQASPYPSTIVVSGLTGIVSKVTVTLSNLGHSYPDDLDILLVGPTGTNVMLMSDAGGSANLPGVNLTFDDQAPGSLPDSDQVNSGNYKPTDYPPADSLPAPAPAGPFGATLAAFNGQNPNGTWKLFVYDDAGSDSGGITNGWSLRFTLGGAVAPPLLSPTLVGSQIQLRFASASGQSYTLQYKNSLDDTSWQTLQTVTGDGTILMVPDILNGQTNRFYRLRLP